MKFRKSTLAAALIPALGFGVAGNAQAGAYGYSYDDIFNLSTTFTCTVSGVGCGGAFNLASYSSTSGADADLNGFAPGVPNAGVSDGVTNGLTDPSPDVDSQFQGTGVAAPGPNSWGQLGQTGDYARGDAQIVQEQVKGAGSTQAINVAEANLGSNVDSSATANGSNSSTTGFEITFTVDEAWSVAFAFDATPFMESLITPGGVDSTVDLDVSFTINDVTTAGSPVNVFNWAPNGAVGNGITGGTETVDDASLNIEVSDIVVDASSVIYDPVNGIGGANCGGVPCNYAASSNQFAAGTYTLILTAHEGVSLRNTALVPAPGVMALMGLGLLGMSYSRRAARKV